MSGECAAVNALGNAEFFSKLLASLRSGSVATSLPVVGRGRVVRSSLESFLLVLPITSEYKAPSMYLWPLASVFSRLEYKIRAFHSFIQQL